MNKIHKLIFIAVMVSVCGTYPVKAQNLSNAGEEHIQNKMLEFLYNYISYSDINSNQIFFSSDFYKEFGKLNSSGMKTLIFNDLTDSLPEQIKLEQYLMVLKQKFSGINIKTVYKEPFSNFGLQYKGAVRISQVIELERTVIAFNKQKKVYRSKNTLYLVVSFAKIGGLFYDFSADYISKQKPELLPLINYKYIQTELGAAFKSNTVTTDEMPYTALDAYQFTTPGYETGIGAIYNLSRSLGVGVGLNANRVSVSMNISSEIKPNWSSSKLTDKDGDLYVPVFNSAVTEKTQFTFVGIPVFAEYRLGNVLKLHAFARAGFEISTMVAGTVTANGNSELKGYYPDINLTLYNLPEYGFVYKDINSEMAISQPHIAISSNISAGVVLPLGTRMSVSGAAFYQTGINAMFSTDNSYRSDYMAIKPESTTFSQKAMGLKVSLLYRLLK
ncbi:MAG TPA: hypothetical protein DCQ31_14310 [Bacteroidales bacterium]|nr:hypothetical protein [Bacteroidales bacterium]